MARILTRSEGESAKVNGRRCAFCRQDQQRPLAWRASLTCRMCVLTLWASLAGTPEQRNGRQMLRGRGRGRELPKSQSTVHPCYCRQGVEADGPKSEPRGRAPLTKFTQVERSKLGCRTVDTAQTDQTHPCRVPSVRIVRVIGRKKFARYTTSPRGVSASSRFCCSALRELSWGWDPGGFLTCALLFMQRVDRLS
ncbi:uncharacterized protein K444DRAFT_437226 [Hyaloscypha bicolor E]|uniref:Uncharacterized protein n=1 Tax=Hyaloscypha bicolor E TaxID=1095630 RepID=A0A2J6T540_9HELO|nr:uncharacterized protein K444DRAFT_437226 [Hyaloscypha bicolor E]PMD58136.1 hypothetical protein K444DRAFT_437226 [Hyaloscypha bicolor E]